MKHATKARSVTADNVRAEMARRRVTQSQLAEALGIGQPAVSGKLKGRSPFDIDELATISEFLHVPLAALIGIDDPFPQPAATGTQQRNRTHGTATRLRSDVRPITGEYWDKWYGYPLRAAA